MENGSQLIHDLEKLTVISKEEGYNLLKRGANRRHRQVQQMSFEIMEDIKITIYCCNKFLTFIFPLQVTTPVYFISHP